MEKKIIKENGCIYEERKGESFTEKILIGNEFSLHFNTQIKKIDEDTNSIKGTIYKQDYQGNIAEISNPVEITFGEFSNKIELQPNGGMVDIDIEIDKDITHIHVSEKDVINVNGMEVSKE
jgi:hypothetical protein